MRERIHKIIEVTNEENNSGTWYDYFIIVVIILSIIPLAFKIQTKTLRSVDHICVFIFIIDYLLRWWTADIKYQSKRAFFYYPFTLSAIIDLISILPSLTIISNGFKVFRLIRLFRAFRVFRVFKIMRYSKNGVIIMQVLKKEKNAMLAVCTFTLAYILIAALTIFNFEPQTFDSFFDAIYWATVSLTTVGYGDIYPVTTPGRIITMISSVIGIAIVALPSGIITAGYMEIVRGVDKDS